MTHKPCSRQWQVEAARDGRLTGSDLSNALRHRAECSDCNRAALALSELGRRIQSMPVPRTDPLVRRRTRHALLGAWNEHLLSEEQPHARRRLALSVAFGVAALTALVALAVGYPGLRKRSPPTASAAPLFEVVAKPGTVWSAREAPEQTRITLADGVASFTVRRAQGQRVFVDLPDGEIEDLGTIFEVEVRGQHTERVSVSQGRVAVRLKTEPAFELGPGQTWQSTTRPAPAPAPALSLQPSPAVPQARAVPAKPSASSATAHGGSARPAPPPSGTRPARDTAEDDAYLQIVDSLRNGNEREARARGLEYLARFPNGFRGREVENIVNRSSAAR